MLLEGGSSRHLPCNPPSTPTGGLLNGAPSEVGVPALDASAVPPGHAAGAHAAPQRVLPGHGLPPEVCPAASQRPAAQPDAPVPAPAAPHLRPAGHPDPGGYLDGGRLSLVRAPE